MTRKDQMPQSKSTPQSKEAPAAERIVQLGVARLDAAREQHSQLKDWRKKLSEASFNSRVPNEGPLAVLFGSDAEGYKALGIEESTGVEEGFSANPFVTASAINEAWQKYAKSSLE